MKHQLSDELVAGLRAMLAAAADGRPPYPALASVLLAWLDRDLAAQPSGGRSFEPTAADAHPELYRGLGDDGRG